MEAELLPAAAEAPPGVYQLKALSPRHKQVAALLVQGVERQVIAQLTEFEPEYITWLGRQPLVVAYLRELEEYANIRLVALADKRTDVISNILDTGSNEDRLKAAKLQMEATGLIGRPREPGKGSEESEDERLARIGARLVNLLQVQRGRVFNGEAIEVAEVRDGS